MYIDYFSKKIGKNVSNLILILGLIIGFILGATGIIPSFNKAPIIFNYTLYALLFFVGLGVGANKRIWAFLKELNVKIILVPIATIVGTFIGVMPVMIFLKVFKLNEVLAVSAGFGYYSLASIIISNNYGYTLGLLALISNLLRESFTIIFSPVLVRLFGKLAPIVSGGATSMDTTLPSVVKNSGEEYAAISIFNGFVLTLLVPFILPLFLK